MLWNAASWRERAAVWFAREAGRQAYWPMNQGWRVPRTVALWYWVIRRPSRRSRSQVRQARIGRRYTRLRGHAGPTQPIAEFGGVRAPAVAGGAVVTRLLRK